MSIWTPSGEHEIQKDQPGQEEASSPVGVEQPAGVEQPHELSPEEEAAMEAEFEETRQRIAESPPEQIIATHVIGLYELAVIHLKQESPNLEAAKLAIDALNGIVSGVGDQLGEYSEAMKNALNEIQMAFVKVSETMNAPATEESVTEGQNA